MSEQSSLRGSSVGLPAGIADPWWVRGLPEYARDVSREQFYKDVHNVRSKPYAKREAEVEGLTHPYTIKFALLVEALSLDKTAGGRICRLFKLVPDFGAFNKGVDDLLPEGGATEMWLRELLDSEERYGAVHKRLVPKKAVVLTATQQEGYEGLQNIERLRKQALGEYQHRENALLQQLKALRLEREKFGAELHKLVPSYKSIGGTRKVTLTSSEVSGLEKKWSSSHEAKARYTLEGFLEASRLNKIAIAERQLYDDFRRFRDESKAQLCVDGAKIAAAQADASRTLAANSSVDDLAPNF
uniref:Uncharacterized protein n=1 Tax=Capillidibolus rugosus virus 1 TaxID=2980983 RepID=A0A977R5I6_9VIRU|nr:hypothetical protein [Capillidibolus rugosus virus 1]